MDEKVIAYIKACMNDESTEEMDVCLFAFTGKELAIMDMERKTLVTDFAHTKNPQWCMRFDIVTNWIYRRLVNNIERGIRSEETELFFWYWNNV